MKKQLLQIIFALLLASATCVWAGNKNGAKNNHGTVASAPSLNPAGHPRGKGHIKVNQAANNTAEPHSTVSPGTSPAPHEDADDDDQDEGEHSASPSPGTSASPSVTPHEDADDDDDDDEHHSSPTATPLVSPTATPSPSPTATATPGH